MNQDAQIFDDNNQLSEEYLHIPDDVPATTKKEDATEVLPHEQPPQSNTTSAEASEEGQKPQQQTKAKQQQQQLNWANPRFSMSSFQLYETKTVKKKKKDTNA